MNDDRGCLVCSKMLLNWRNGHILCSEGLLPQHRLDVEDGQSITATEVLLNVGRVCPLFEMILVFYNKKTFTQMIDEMLKFRQKHRG